MTLKAKTVYNVICDTCGQKLVHMGSHRFYTKDHANTCARERGWTVGKGGGHWCGCEEPS